MEEREFLYKKGYGPIHVIQSEKMPGCFYYEWFADQDVICLPDGRSHYIWGNDHFEVLRYEKWAVSWEADGQWRYAIGIDPAYALTQEAEEIKDLLRQLEAMTNLAERRAYYERKGMQSLQLQIIHPLVEQVITQMKESGGCASVEQIATELTYTPRQLENVFKRQYGYGPKRYSRMLRIQEAVSYMGQAKTMTLAQIACG